MTSTNNKKVENIMAAKKDSTIITPEVTRYDEETGRRYSLLDTSPFREGGESWDRKPKTLTPDENNPAMGWVTTRGLPDSDGNPEPRSFKVRMECLHPTAGYSDKPDDCRNACGTQGASKKTNTKKKKSGK